MPLEYGAALSKLLGALNQNVGAGLGSGGRLVAIFDGVLTPGFDAVAAGVPVAPWEDRDALELRVASVAVTLRRDRFSRAEWCELNHGAAQELSMSYGELRFTLRWAL
jgi:hypothetical protein